MEMEIEIGVEMQMENGTRKNSFSCHDVSESLTGLFTGQGHRRKSSNKKEIRIIKDIKFFLTEQVVKCNEEDNYQLEYIRKYRKTPMGRRKEGSCYFPQEQQL